MSLLNPRFAMMAALVAVGLSACDPTPKANQTMLVSIAGLRLASPAALQTFSLEMKNLRVRAICHVPAGWTVAAGNPSRRSLMVEGNASSKSSELKNDALNELEGLLLVQKWAEDVKTDDRSETIDLMYLYVNPDDSTHLGKPAIVVEPADRCPARSAEKTMLMSIRDVRLERTQAAYFMALSLQNLRVRAICNVPMGWTLATGIDSEHGLVVEGQASSGVYELKGDSLKELKGVLLVEKESEGRDSEIDGALYLEVGGKGPDGTIVPLTSHIVLEPAETCPAPDR